MSDNDDRTPSPPVEMILKRPAHLEEDKEGSPQKKARMSPLHMKGRVPLEFLLDAVNDPGAFAGSGGTGGTFGIRGEAYERSCYRKIMREVRNEMKLWASTGSMRIVAVRGSAGVGKSAFLAYTIATMRRDHKLKDFAVFYSGKANKTSDIKFSVWDGGELVMEKELYGNPTALKTFLDQYLPKMSALFMDGCTTTFSLDEFRGMIIVAAPPSVTTRDLQAEIDARLGFVTLYMPPWTKAEILEVARLLAINDSIVLDNFVYMKGIVRYMFKAGAAKEHIKEAVKMVDASRIASMIATQNTDKDTEKSMVHSLCLWNCATKNGEDDYRGDVSCSLVSRFAERLVAEKLYASDSAELNKTRRALAPVPGAESYAGALFEAYAIREFLRGGIFHVRPLNGDKEKNGAYTIDVPEMSDPVVVESNTLSLATVPPKTVHLKAADNSWTPRLLWPTTTNFPTFDAYYFHTDGDVYALQMTISSKHPLNNNGAFQTKNYLDKLGETVTPPYKAVFVVPQGRATFKAQNFTGSVSKGGEMDEKDAVALMNQSFQQWAVELP